MTRLAILAGQGALPHQIAAAHPDALFAHFVDLGSGLPSNETLQVSYERFGEMFAGLKQAGVTEVVFAGGLARPALNPANFDDKMRMLAPGFMAAMQGGDDALLRAVILAFEEEGFTVKGAHEVLPDLTVRAEQQGATECTGVDASDAARAWKILQALGSLDVAQACVVARGICLGIETAQGTEALLGFVAQTRGALKSAQGGVLVKWTKPNQDLRVDMPAIGPDTVDQARAAGLQGICIEAGAVLVLERNEVIRRADAAGISIWAVTCFPST